MTKSSIINTFVIPHLSNKGVLRCLKTLWRHTPHNFRVILVDQGKEDLTEEIKGLVHLYIKAYRPLGFAKACNIGWQLADTKYVTLLNDDVEFVHKNWWKGVEDSFEEDVVGVNPMSSRQYSTGMKITDSVPYKKKWSLKDYNEMLRLPFRHTQCMAMFCTIIDQEIGKKIGIFDEFFFPAGGEDTDWIIRAKALRESQNHHRGYKVISTPKSYVWHWWNQSAVDPTFMKARIQLRQKWGMDFDMMKATTGRIVSNPIKKEL